MKKRNPGTRQYFRLQDRIKFAELRSAIIKQTGLLDVVGSATVSRLESGGRCREKTSLKLYDALQREAKAKGKPGIGSFDAVFKPAPTKPLRKHKYDWKCTMRGAKHMRVKMFSEFHADAIVTFAGPSAIFANLVLAGLPRERLLVVPVYLAMVRDHPAPDLVLPGFRREDGKGFAVFLPDTVVTLAEQDPERKIRWAIIDDNITTGEAIVALKSHMKRLGYEHPASVRVGCLVCHEMATLIPERRPDVWEFMTTTTTYQLPWGDPLFHPRHEPPVT